MLAECNVIPYDKDIDFPVILKRVFTDDGVEVARSRAVVRTDTNQPIAMVSDRYKPITYRTFLDGAADFIKELGEPTIICKTERNGARLLATLTFKNHVIQIGDRNRAALRIVMRSGYHSGQAATVEVQCTVLECLNLCVASEKTVFTLSVRHAGDVTAFEFPKPEIVLESFVGQKAIMDKFAATKIEEERGVLFLGDANEAMANVVPARSRVRITDHWLKEKDQRTSWDLFQHCTSEITHHSPNLSLTGRLQRLARVARNFNTEFAGY